MDTFVRCRDSSGICDDNDIGFSRTNHDNDMEDSHTFDPYLCSCDWFSRACLFKLSFIQI
jgi:hypothetical protein